MNSNINSRGRLEFLEKRLLDVDLEYRITGNFKYKLVGKAIQEEINEIVLNLNKINNEDILNSDTNGK